MSPRTACRPPIRRMTPNFPRAKRSLGQHFLHDAGYCRRIVRLAAPTDRDTVIEIGPGTGQLTHHLLARARKVVAIEFDRDLVALLERRLPHRLRSRLTLIQSDALELDWDSILPEAPVKLVGNLPYNIATALLTKMIPFGQRFHNLTFMVQKEVAQRILARPGSKSYGYLTLLLQYHFHGVPGFDVPAGAFAPPPEVRSHAMQLVPRPRPARLPCYDLFLRLIRTGFGHRRKTLRNNLQGAFGPWKGRLEPAFRSAGIEPRRRAEELSLEQFVCLARML